MEYKEFLEKVQKKRTKKVYKITGSWGVHDALNHIRKNHWYNIGRPVTEKEFYAIIRGVNKLLAESFANGNDIEFPHAMGVLEMRKIKAGVRLIKGKLVNTYPVDWEKTMKLWYEDEEAREQKLLIRHESDYVCILFYNRFKATYKNQIYYEFKCNRFMTMAAIKNFFSGKIDVLW